MRIDITSRVCWLASQLFGCHIRQRAHKSSGLSQAGRERGLGIRRQQLRQPKVEYLDLAPWGDKNIRWLRPPMRCFRVSPSSISMTIKGRPSYKRRHAQRQR
jgi:hypothetical protein